MAEAAVAEVLATYCAALHECDADKFHGMWHARGVLLGLGPDGAVVARSAEEFCAGVVARGRSPEYAEHDRVLSVELVDSRCASAKVQIALPPAPASPTPTTSATLYTDWLTLLRDPALNPASGGSWRIISKIYSSAPLGGGAAAQRPILPEDFQTAAAAVWDGYVRAGRSCDAAAMARIFHPACNLTFAAPDGVAVVSCDEFCERVAKRWEMDAHKAFAHLRDDPRASAADSLVSLDFAGPSVCRAVLRIGYPPFLYTDVLLLLKLSAPLNGRGGGWWVVAKSSGNVPFLAQEARP